MSTNNKFIISPRLKSWVVAIIIFLSISIQQSAAQEEYPNWIAYDIGNVWGSGVTSLASENDTLWIGTVDRGLIKLNKITLDYHVYNLKNYGFKDNWVESIVVDKRSNKWFLTKEGFIAKYDSKNWTLYDSLGSFSGGFNKSIKKDNQENIWVVGYEKIAKFNGKQWELYNTSDLNSPFYKVTALAFDSTGHIWAGTFSFDSLNREIVEIYDGKRQLIMVEGLKEYFKSYPSCIIWDIQVSKNGTKWLIINDNFTGWMTLVKFSDESNSIIVESHSDYYDFLSEQFNITIESDSSIWIGGNQYLRWYGGEETFILYTFSRGIQDDCVRPIIIDEYGNKWIAVYDCYNLNANYPTYIVVLNDNGVKLSVDKDPQINQATIYPNPASDYIYINSPLTDGAGGVWEYQIYDLLGNCVQRGIIESDKINISKLSTGFYTVRFNNGGKQVVVKMMKE